MPKKKDGTKITWSEFLKLWKEGIQNLTPIQKLTNEARGNFITLIGFIAALVAMIIFRDKFIVSWFAYGLILVFIGSIWTTAIKWLGIRQQLKVFKDIDGKALSVDEIFDELEKENKLETFEEDEKKIEELGELMKENKPDVETNKVSDKTEVKNKDEK